ncbi:hypothetical protein Y032_0064g3573 [Ancylostoma ceylanicum]|uniref:Mos1 transposase HTH domain-containing protein n=1 Tax=Ancylostoma ceylanicum TaxID=53326 RepID=A0A016U1V7_9BILA|nr:hypothetical protein Y032_0064g3573 [Ancylostoma ceylanicum]
MNLKKKVFRTNLLLWYCNCRTAEEAYRFLLDSINDQASSQATCFIRYREFKNGEESLHEDPRIGRLLTQKRSVAVATCETQSNFSVRDKAGPTQTPKLLARFRSCLEYFLMSRAHAARGALTCVLLSSAIDKNLVGSIQ